MSNFNGDDYAISTTLFSSLQKLKMSILADPAAGGSDDWAMAVAGSNLAYTVELPGGSGGFVIDASQIGPVGKETFEAIKVFAKYTAQFNNQSNDEFEDAKDDGPFWSP